MPRVSEPHHQVRAEPASGFALVRSSKLMLLPTVTNVEEFVREHCVAVSWTDDP